MIESPLSVCRQVKDTGNKGPHHWDMDRKFSKYLHVFDRIAHEVERGRADGSKPLAIDASTATFTFSGVGVNNKPTEQVRLATPCA